MSCQSVLITGCSDGGIGSALAAGFQERGFHVFATARNKAKMKSLEALSNVTLLELDVTKADGFEAFASTVAKQTGGTLDVLVLNAGRNRYMPILDEDLDHIRSLFEVNLIGPLAMTQAFAPLLIKAKGQAVYITSSAGHVNFPYMGTYAATKRGLEIVAETLRLELAPFGVNVIEVVTGPVYSMGNDHFKDLTLPKNSLYKSIESILVTRASGEDGMERMKRSEYAEYVLAEIAKRTPGRIWCGALAGDTRDATTSPVPQSFIDERVSMGTGLDTLGFKD